MYLATKNLQAGNGQIHTSTFTSETLKSFYVNYINTKNVLSKFYELFLLIIRQNINLQNRINKKSTTRVGPMVL